jgi:FG-GAP-like repeat
MNQDQSLANNLTALDPAFKHQAIWHNTLTNEITWSQLSGSAIVATKALPATSPDWRLTATGDVNHDGELDVLLRHSSGVLLWWMLRDGTMIDGQYIVGGPADQRFQIVGTGDVNADGNLDLIWQHAIYGTFAWYIDALKDATKPVSYIGYGGFTPPEPHADWQFATTGDVHQDGGLDLLWVNRPKGLSQWSQIRQGMGLAGSRLNQSIGPNQRNTTNADLNGDGALDLVVQDVTVGTSDLWMMSKPDINGTISTISRSVVSGRERLGTIDKIAGWQIAGVANMDAGNTLANATYQPSGIFSQSQTIGGVNDRTDVYLFGLGAAGTLSASLSGLSADAEVRLISDRNGNGQIDPSEVLASSWERGPKAKSLEVFLKPGGYFLEVRSYDDRLTNYQLATGFTPSKLDIQLNYDVTSAGLTATTRAALTAAEDFWEAALSGGGTLVPSGILSIRIVTEDLNLNSGGPDNLTLAYSGPSARSTNGQTLEIASASATINRRRINTIGPDDQINLFIHEFTHALGFGTLWEPLSFRNTDGSIRQIGVSLTTPSLIDTNKNYRFDTYAGWAYGELLRDAGRATTVAPTAVPLEAGIQAHWRESLFQTESLTPVSNGGNQPISKLTLAAMQDLGWKVNYGMAMAYQLPATSAASVNIDFNDLNRPNAASNVATAPSHASNCGCAVHLVGDRPSLAAMIGLSPA